VYERKGRALVIVASRGIQDTLDGHTANNAKSYLPATARDLAANVVLFALMDKLGSQTKPAK
jgi:hypothetical protein